MTMPNPVSKNRTLLLQKVSTAKLMISLNASLGRSSDTAVVTCIAIRCYAAGAGVARKAIGSQLNSSQLSAKDSGPLHCTQGLPTTICSRNKRRQNDAPWRHFLLTAES